VNLLTFAGMKYRESQSIRAKGLDPELVRKFESLTVEISTPVYKSPIPFHARLLKPAKTEDRRKYPLIVFLHGVGERGHGNLILLKSLPQQMAMPDWQERFSSYLLAPQCPEKMYWSSLVNLNETSKAPKNNLLD
jgi:predicted peptidase